MIGPFGVMNPALLFWTRKCKVIEIHRLKGGHLRMILDDGTSSIRAIKWNESIQIKTNDLIDIAFYIEMNKWKNNNNLQLNIVDIKMYNKEIDLKIHNNSYKCQITDNSDILITNTKGQFFCSDLSVSSDNLNKKQVLFAKKILNFAEVALGKVA